MTGPGGRTSGSVCGQDPKLVITQIKYFNIFQYIIFTIIIIRGIAVFESTNELSLYCRIRRHQIKKSTEVECILFQK